jgi:hypothetical protein
MDLVYLAFVVLFALLIGLMIAAIERLRGGD